MGFQDNKERDCHKDNPSRIFVPVTLDGNKQCNKSRATKYAAIFKNRNKITRTHVGLFQKIKIGMRDVSTTAHSVQKVE